jgi:hypothetical protein
MQSNDNQSIKPEVGAGEQAKRWTTPADSETIARTIRALEQRGIHAELVADKAAALDRLTQLIPPGAQVMTGGSMTLDEIGFLEKLKSDSHGWKNVKTEILAEKDPAKQMELRLRSTLSEYFVGSVQAVTEDGEVVAASAGGSQLAAYAYGAKNSVWVVGTQKIVGNLEEALKRIREHALPLEDKRMKGMGYPGSFVGKILIVDREDPRHTAHLIFVNEPLGF